MFAHKLIMSRPRRTLPAFTTLWQSLALSFAIAPIAISSLVAQELPESPESGANAEHLKILSARVSRLSMTYTSSRKATELQLLEHPVMRTGNKEGNPDGAVWLWLDGKRPVAAQCIWNRGPLWYSENSSLVDDLLEVTGWPKATWHAPGTGRTSLTLPEPVPESPVSRRRTLRALALEFTAREDRLGIKSELRLLPRPIYTYTNANDDALDRALFAFVYGTDPEVLMQIEARQDASAKHWVVRIARLAGAELWVHLREKEIWSVPAISKDAVIKTTAEYCIIREDP